MLKIPNSVIIYEITTGENQVPFISGETKYGYLNYIERYDPVCPMMGFLKSSPELSKYTTLEQYKIGEHEKFIRLLEQSKMTDEQKRAYYLKTKPLADEFAIILAARTKDIDTYGAGSKKFLKGSANKQYHEFISQHANLFDDRYHFVDIRFGAIFEEGTPYIDPQTNENRYPTTIYEIDPLASIEKFLTLAAKSEARDRKFQIEEIEGNIAEINEDYQSFVAKAKQLLKTHDKVGLINPSMEGDEVYIPKRMKNKTSITIEQFSIDDFANADKDTIYWFK